MKPERSQWLFICVHVINPVLILHLFCVCFFALFLSLFVYVCSVSCHLGLTCAIDTLLCLMNDVSVCALVFAYCYKFSFSLLRWCRSVSLRALCRSVVCHPVTFQNLHRWCTLGTSFSNTMKQRSVSCTWMLSLGLAYIFLGCLESGLLSVLLLLSVLRVIGTVGYRKRILAQT